MVAIDKAYKLILKAIVTFFGSGLISKKMPGTVGSLCATIIVLSLPRSCFLTLSLAILTLFLGTITSHIYVKKYETDLDPGYIVIDEVAGIFFGIALLYFIGFQRNIDITLNFCLFRFFDIFKPYPIKNIEKFFSQKPNYTGFAIMIDDIIASIFSVILQLIIALMFMNNMASLLILD